VARSLLETNLARRQPVPDVARSVGLSPEEFTRQYTADMGLSPAAWQLEQRLHRAATMLAQQVPVVQVAHACGFADASHLGRHFKRRFRVSPARWASDHSAPGPAARPQSNE
jgi:transcriptional regulator GlxA family with amidase domain